METMQRVPGTVGTDIEELTDVRLMREFISRLFARHLTPRERKILSLYYGLEEGSEALTLEKIGELLGVTRIDQITRNYICTTQPVTIAHEMSAFVHIAGGQLR